MTTPTARFRLLDKLDPRDLAVAETKERFPIVTGNNLNEVRRFFDSRVIAHRASKSAAIADHARILAECKAGLHKGDDK